LKYVVDANVPIVASGRDTHVDIVAQLKAAKFIRDVMTSGVVLEDEEDLAVGEYRRHLDFSGQPTMGDEFFSWLVRERWIGCLVQRVPSPAGQSILSVLPSSLAGFDSDDHKWICIYIQGNADYIVNAVDTDWADAKVDLDSEGVRLLELLA
jgi:hypothetical protein